MSVERRDARIEECDGGYIVRLRWDWREKRGDDDPEPIDRTHLFMDLNSAVGCISNFMHRPLDEAVLNSLKD